MPMTKCRNDFSKPVYLIIEGGTVCERPLASTWDQTLEALWCGEYVSPLNVIELDIARGTNTDATAEAVLALAARTRAEGFCPGCLDPLFEDFGYDAPDRDRPRNDWYVEHMLSGRQLGLAGCR